MMPPFLGTEQEGRRSGNKDLRVRYAMSAFDDLNSAIRNLRHCFGFPYREYIGYLNTITRQQRIRREHDGLADRLRRWAIAGNVDAVFWIDFSKANEPSGSFKMGPYDSRPFSVAHIELCTHAVKGDSDNDGDESEDVAWSEVDEEGLGGGTGKTAISVDEEHVDQQRSQLSGGRRRLGLACPEGQNRQRGFVRTTDQLLATPRELGSLGGVQETSSDRRVGVNATKHKRQGISPHMVEHTHEDSLLRDMIQDEYIPAYGSIYKRSIAPGPGHYGAPGKSPTQGGVTFSCRPRGRIDEAIAIARELPGPGEYNGKKAFTESKAALGSFGKAPKLVMPTEISRKLPFMSTRASEAEGHGVHSPSTFHTVSPDAPCYTRDFQQAPKYSFGKARRPW